MVCVRCDSFHMAGVELVTLDRQAGWPARGRQAGPLGAGRLAHSGQAGWPARGRQAGPLGAGRQARQLGAGQLGAGRQCHLWEVTVVVQC